MADSETQPPRDHTRIYGNYSNANISQPIAAQIFSKIN